MANVTRNYYVPRNNVGRHIINRIVENVPCSIDGVTPKRAADTFCVTLSCNAKDISKIENILKSFGVLEKK